MILLVYTPVMSRVSRYDIRGLSRIRTHVFAMERDLAPKDVDELRLRPDGIGEELAPDD